MDLLESQLSSQEFVKVNSFDEKKTLQMASNSKILLKEWLPEEDETVKQLAIAAPDQTYTEKVTMNESQKEIIDFEYVFCIGGDGTLLRLLRILFFRFLPPTLPKIVTFSMGSLGYLCNFQVTELLDVLNSTVLAPSSKIIQDKIKIDYRSRLSCSLEDQVTGTPISFKRVFVDSQGGKEVQPAICHALNEISITRGNAEFMCRFDVYINDSLLTIVQGDGVLISTPTGSTAYNLSCGGSIIHPGTDAVALTPICPHSLSFRPIILPKTAKISIVLPEEARTGAWVTFDGQMRFKMERTEKLVIKESAFCVPFVLKKETNIDQDWVEKLRRTLKWNKTIIQKPINSKSRRAKL